MKEIIDVLFLLVVKLMGFLNRSENSLNQHIKIKHYEFWKKLKNSNKKIFTMDDIIKKPTLNNEKLFINNIANFDEIFNLNIKNNNMH